MTKRRRRIRVISCAAEVTQSVERGTENPCVAGSFSALVTIDNKARLETVEQLATEQGWRIVGRDRHPVGTTDYSAALGECKRSGAQVLFVWAYSPETSSLIRQWSDTAAPALPVGFIGAAEDPGFWKATDGKCAYTIVTLSETGNAPRQSDSESDGKSHPEAPGASALTRPCM